MIWTITWRSLAAVVVLGIIVITGAFAVVQAPQLAELRGRLAADLLSRYLGEAVDVSGDVALTFGPTIDIAIQGVAPVAPSTTATPVGRVRLSFARDAALRGRLVLTALDLAGIRVIIDAGQAAASTISLGERLARAVEHALSSPLRRELEIEDLEIRRINDPKGWNGTLQVDDLRSQEADAAGMVALDGRGTLNKQPFTLKGQVPDLAPSAATADGENVSLNLALKGVDIGLNGRLSQGDDGISVTARLNAESPSLGDLQELLQLARVAEGAGSLVMTLEGALERLAVGSAKLRIEGANGRGFEAEGSVTDLWALDGVDLTFDATLAKPGAEKKAASAFSVAPRSIEGRVSRRAGAFEIDEVLVQTDLAAVELQTIGPIRIGAIARDEQGRLKLDGIRLIQGDANDPELDLSAHLDDVLALRGFALAGQFALDMGGVLIGRQGATGLGRLRGEVALSDASGRLRLETLAAELEGTPLMSLSLGLEDSSTQKATPWLGVDLTVNVPDLAPLASAIGRTGKPGFQVAFDGQLTAGTNEARVSGSARLGSTDLDGQLSIRAPTPKPEITGRIHAKELHFDDLLAARKLPALVAHRDREMVRVHDDIAETASLSLDLSANGVEGAGTRTGGLSAHLAYDRSRLRLSSLELAYLGGQINGDIAADLGASPPAVQLDAKVRRLSLERLFRRLESPPVASGPLDLDLAVTARGADLSPALGSLNGQVSATLRGGVLADRTINLAGQNIIAWAFSRTESGAPLDCLVARFDFAEGIGTAKELVFETDKVQVVGSGQLDLPSETMDLVMIPRPKQNALIGKVRHVNVTGPIAHPRVQVAKGAVATKVVGDTLGLPLHLLGSIVGADGRLPPEHRPCVVVP